MRLRKAPGTVASVISSRDPARPPADTADRPVTPPDTTTVTDRAPGPSSPDVQVLPSSGDGGFRDRLFEAQHANGVRGVPGSDTRLAPGIQLMAPETQGIAGAMRKTQRLFGIASAHCKDVETLQGLTSEQLIARHVSPAQVKRDAEKYDCDRPLGLSF